MKERIAYLVKQYRTGVITEPERKELFDLIQNDAEGKTISEGIALDMQSIEPTAINEDKWKPIVDKILDIDRPHRLHRPHGVSQRGPRVNRLHEVSGTGPRVRQMYKWIAAAVVLIAVATTYVVISKRSEKSPSAIAVAHDVPAPKETRAVITLADGTKVYLDSVNNGTIAQQNNVAVIKNSEGGIQYLSPAGGGDLSTSPNNKRPGVDFNTLSNPRGSKVISLTLSDGTKVWLNSESSLKYPIAFNDKTREVEITGEAYFEVKHNSKQPFKVHLPNGSIVEDIGTSFNINSYPDENDIKTTLIEGSVRVVANSEQRTANSLTLKPGQQAVYNANSQQLTANSSVDLDEVLAWKNGKFSFHSADLASVLRQAARWYDVDVQYQRKIDKRFNGELDRTTSLSNLLKALELSGGVQFKIEGKKIIVTK